MAVYSLSEQGQALINLVLGAVGVRRVYKWLHNLIRSLKHRFNKWLHSRCHVRFMGTAA